MGKTIIVKGADFSANAIDTTTTKCRITYAFTNINSSSRPSSVNVGASLSIQLTTSGSYTYPDTVSVTNKSTGAAISGVTYNSSTGLITISAVTVDIIITATGKAVQGALAITYALTHVSAPNQPTSYVSGNTISIQFTKANGYGYPSSVTVTNTTTSDVISSGISYNASTGLLTITGATVPLTITAEGVVSGDEPSTQPDLVIVSGNSDAYDVGTGSTRRGGIIASTGAVNSSLNQWHYSDYIDIDQYDRYNVVTDSLGTGGTVGLAFYDSSNNYISNSGVAFASSSQYVMSGIFTLPVTPIPSGAKYIRYCCMNEPNSGEAKTVTLNFYE